jgi:glycosyltransferase involved in cell wall biosynthesis
MDSPISSPLVSVVLLAYNQPEFLNQAIEGVCAQTFTDYELLVIDDCSGEEITSQYRLPENARLICFPEHFGGDSKGRNIGVMEAKGKYIAFLDNDDVWLPDKLETQVRLLDENPDAALVYSHYIVTDSFLKPRAKQYTCEPPAKDMTRQLIRSNIIRSSSTILVRRHALIEAGPFDESLLSSNDRDMWLRLSLENNFICDPTPRVLYRIHPNQATKKTRKKALNRIECLKKALELMRLKSTEHIPNVHASLARAYRKLAKANMAHNRPCSEVAPLLFKSAALRPWCLLPYLHLCWLPFHAVLRLLLPPSGSENDK